MANPHSPGRQPLKQCIRVYTHQEEQEQKIEQKNNIEGIFSLNSPESTSSKLISGTSETMLVT